MDLPAASKPILSNLTIPAAKFCRISILRPTDRSVKIREYEPSTGFSADSNTDVITWDALKLDPSSKADINVYLTQSGAGPQIMELKTESGLQYADVDGPVCCAATQVPEEIKFHPKAFGSGSEGEVPFTVQYDACTGQPLASPASTTNPFKLLEYGAFVCEGDETTYNKQTCILIKKLGPNPGAALVADGASFYGWGNRIYMGPALTGIQEEGCEPTPGEERDQVTYNNGIVTKFNDCGYAEGFASDGETPLNKVTLWIGVGGSNGKMDTSQVYKVLAGPHNGSIIDANPSYLCVVYGIGCYR
jgi:hypothetical protein